MKLKVELELTDVYGGDGQVRYEPKEKVTLTRTRTKTTIKQSIGIAVPLTTEEQVKEQKLEPIATFRLREDGTPMLRLGGAHGKFWGSLKACAKQLYELDDEDFKSSYKSAVDMILVSPAWVPLEGVEELIVEGIPQILKGTNGGMVVQLYDVVPKARATVVLMFPDALEKKVRKLLEQVQVAPHLNKRRAVVSVTMTTELRP